MTRPLAAALTLACAALAACEKPKVSPGLDITCRPSDPTCQPGRISGNVVYSGRRRGDVILFLFKTSALPPPDGLGTTATAFARIGRDEMFGSDDSSVGPFAANYTFTQVPPDTYQIRGFVDSHASFRPFFDFAQQPRAGDPVGGHVSFDAQGTPSFAEIVVRSAGDVPGVPVALGQELPFDPPVFTIASAVDNAVNIPQSLDRPLILRLKTSKLGGSPDLPSFEKASFGIELKLDQHGLPAISDGDGFFDAYPQVLLRQLDQLNEDGSRSPVDALRAAIIPAKVNTLPVLPLLFAAPTGGPVGVEQIDIAVLPFAGHLLPPSKPGGSPGFDPISSIPAGSYQLVVIEKTGQVWTMPNSLSPQIPSQATQIEVVPTTVPPGRLRGTVKYQGSALPGNLIIQAYKADPANPPPPNGTQLPVRVKIIRTGQITKSAGGFSVAYQLDGLAPGKYLVQALSDGDGNFAPFNLLQTPTKGDLIGGSLDTLGHLRIIDIATGPVDGVDVTLVGAPGGDTQGSPGLDAPAFEIDESTSPAQIAQDARGTVRFTVKAKPVVFPIGAGAAETTRFTVALVRDAAGKTVDSDGDGLPDVWPRAFLVQLDDNDPTGLTQKTPTTVLPAAVDPTPYLPRLLASPAPVLASQLSIIVRPAALDASNPSALKRLPVMPAGRYKVVLMNATGQLWQVPNEAGTAALDPRAAALSSATASQSKSFRVLPATAPAPTGAIAGNLKVALPQGQTSFVSAYVFATDARNPPPPLGTGKPISVDFHASAEFSPAGTVAFALRGLPPGSYYVTAVADTRGDFALEPQLFGAAPGQGALVGGHFDSSLARLETVTVGGASVTADVVVGRALPIRPSFVLLTPSALPVTSDLGASAPFFPDALSPQRVTLHAQQVLGAGIGTLPETGPAFFPVTFQGCQSAAPTKAVDGDFDNLPDVYPRVLVVKLSDADPTGLAVDPVTTVIPAAIDPTPFLGLLGDCSLARTVVASNVSVVLSPIAVQPQVDGNLKQVPIPPGRYGFVLISATGQTWRIPNELQPALLDLSVPAETAASLASQSVALRVGGQVPVSLPGGIRGVVHLTGYSSATVGNLVLAVYAANAPPPPLGLGRPVAVQIVPRAIVAGVAAAGNGLLPYQISNVANGTYLVAALHDPLNRFSPSLSYLATPPLGGQFAFVGGAAPSGVAVAGGFSSNNDIFLDAVATPSIPFERPMFALDATSTLSVSSSATPGSAAVVKLAARTPDGLPYAVSGGPALHPILATCGASGKQTQDQTQSCTPGLPYQDMNTTRNCGASGHPWVSTQIYVTPLDTGARFVPFVSLNACQFCPALTGTADCTAAPLQPPNGPLPLASITIGITNIAVDPLTKSAAGVPLPPGHYAITVIEPTGLVWTLPNELAGAGGVSGAEQSAVFTVTP